MERRDLFKLAGVSLAAATLAGCKVNMNFEAAKPIKPKLNSKRVLVVGAGFGGLSVAKQLRLKDNSLDVIVLDKKDIFMSNPYSNAYLGGLDDVSLESLMHDFYGASKKYGYEFIQTEVTSIDTYSKAINTTSGSFLYDILVLSPGIEYDYEKQFPTWNKEKIAEVSKSCPAALISGGETLALRRQLSTMSDGDVVIIPPAFGKYRCPTAPYERVALMAHHMKQEGILGKVILLDTKGPTFGKTQAFKESWEALYGSRIEHIEHTKITNITPSKKTIHFTQYKDEHDTIGVEKTVIYEVCNFMPLNKTASVIAMSGIKTTSSGFALMEGNTFRSLSNPFIYVLGDCVNHFIPATAGSAIWGAKRAALEIIAQLGGASFNSASSLPAKNANVCYSLVNGNPHEAIMVAHDFEINTASGNISSNGAIMRPTDGHGFFRSKGLGKTANARFIELKKELFE